jgi:hypothetical protein
MKFLLVMLAKSHPSEKAGVRLRSSGNFIYIKRITEDGLFDRCSGYVAREGMRVLRIANIPVDGMHEDNLLEIINRASGKLKFLLAYGSEKELRTVKAKDIIEITVKKPKDGKFKLSIAGFPGNVCVTKIAQGSPFEDTALRIGDTLLGADTIDFANMQASHIREFLREASGFVTFIARSNEATVPSMAAFRVENQVFEIDPQIIDSFPERVLPSRSCLKRYSTSKPVRLDGDPNRFHYIIEWMRKGRIRLPASISRPDFLADLEVYGFQRIDSETIEAGSKLVQAFNVKHVKSTMSKQQEHIKELEELEKEMSDEVNYGRFASTLASAAFAEMITGDDDTINLSSIGKSSWKYNLRPNQAVNLEEGKLAKVFASYMAAYDMNIQHVRGWTVSVEERGDYSITDVKKNKQKLDHRLRNLEAQLVELREEIRFRKFSTVVAREAFSQMITVERQEYIDLTDVALAAKDDYLETGDFSGDSEEKLGAMFESYLVSYGLYVVDINKWKVRLDFVKDAV